jgi:hypothetical protein
MTRSLIIAHQCTVDTLQRLEEEEIQQPHTESDPPSPPSTPDPFSIGRVVRVPAEPQPSRPFNNQNFWLPLRAEESTGKRASIWMKDLMFDNSPLPDGFRRQTWSESGSAFIDQQPYYFLRKWTDQGERLSEMRKMNFEHPPRQDFQAGGPDGETPPTKPVILANSGPSPHHIVKSETGDLLSILPKGVSEMAPFPTLPADVKSSNIGGTYSAASETDYLI